jgi:hypothetical protein
VTLSLRGRLETRAFLLATVGLLWTLLSAFLAGPTAGSVWSGYRSALAALAVMGALGLGWELVYHGLQQLRWDRDWPSAFALLTVANEAVLLWVVAGALPGVDRGSAGGFALRITTTWLAMWTFAQGPMRVLFPRWRLHGGRLS